MNRFEELTAFVAVAEEASFTAAARRLSVAPSRVTRLVAALEARLDVRLFARTTRRVALTEAGRRLFADAQPALRAVLSAEAEARGEAATPMGVLRITAPTLFGGRLLRPVLCAYLNAFPQMRADLALLDRPVDLVGEGYDVALRIGDAAPADLRAVTLGDVRRRVVAAPGYVAQSGRPTAPADLVDHRIIAQTSASEGATWRFVGPGGDVTVRLTPTMAVNAQSAAVEAAAAGFGVTRAFSYQVADLIRAGVLIPLLDAYETRDAPVRLLHAEGARPAAKIRSFLDFAGPPLRRALAETTTAAAMDRAANPNA